MARVPTLHTVLLTTVESFTQEEQEILRRYFTNLDQPVFALVNLPEVVKGALFARYSRSAKSLRRLFLDEFVMELSAIPAAQHLRETALKHGALQNPPRIWSRSSVVECPP